MAHLPIEDARSPPHFVTAPSVETLIELEPSNHSEQRLLSKPRIACDFPCLFFLILSRVMKLRNQRGQAREHVPINSGGTAILNLTYDGHSEERSFLPYFVIKSQADLPSWKLTKSMDQEIATNNKNTLGRNLEYFATFYGI